MRHGPASTSTLTNTRTSGRSSYSYSLPKVSNALARDASGRGSDRYPRVIRSPAMRRRRARGISLRRTLRSDLEYIRLVRPTAFVRATVSSTLGTRSFVNGTR